MQKRPSRGPSREIIASSPLSRVSFTALIWLGLALSAIITPVAVIAAEELSLEQALAEARTGHPRLVAAREGIVRFEGRREHASRRANPRVSVTVENVPWNATEGFQYSNELDWFAFMSQPIGVWGKRGHRMEVADAAVANAVSNADSVERDVLFQVGLAYERAALQKRLETLIRESADRWTELVERNRLRVEEGYLAEGELLRSRIEASQRDQAAQIAALTAERSLIELLRAIGRQTFNPLPSLSWSAPLVSGEIPDPEALRASAQTRPEILAAEARLREAEAQLSLTRVQLRPDPTAIFGYKRSGPNNTLFLGSSIPLPLWYRNRGATAEARATLAIRQAERDSLLSVANAEVESALRAHASARRRLESLGEGFVDRATEVRSIAETAYEEGAIELIQFLDADRAYRDANSLYLEALFALRASEHELRRAGYSTEKNRP